MTHCGGSEWVQKAPLTKNHIFLCIHHLMGLRKGLTQTSHVLWHVQTVVSPAVKSKEYNWSELLLHSGKPTDFTALSPEHPGVPDESQQVWQQQEKLGRAGVSVDGGSGCGVTHHKATRLGFLQVCRPARSFHHPQHGVQTKAQLGKDKRKRRDGRPVQQLTVRLKQHLQNEGHFQRPQQFELTAE